jgi:hypothetical protein
VPGAPEAGEGVVVADAAVHVAGGLEEIHRRAAAPFASIFVLLY